MESESVLTEKRGRVFIIRINRPDALNAMNSDVFCGLADALTEASSANDVAVALITGNGRAFCAGLDLAETNKGFDDDSPPSTFPLLLDALTHFRKPLIAAVNGLGVGIGMTMLAHCDLVFMSNTAKLRTPFPQLGLAPEAGSSSTFTERLGWQNAAYTLMSGRWFSAEECLAMGLVWRICTAEELLEESLTVADELAANPIPSLIATKELLLASGRAENAWAAHKREVRSYRDLMGAPANREAISAFTEKREANFTNIEGL